MEQPSAKPERIADPRTKTPADLKAERLAVALRANLQRRKTQQRQRENDPGTDLGEGK